MKKKNLTFRIKGEQAHDLLFVEGNLNRPYFKPRYNENTYTEEVDLEFANSKKANQWLEGLWQEYETNLNNRN